MEASHLHSLWESPDNSRLTSKQYSFRLPVHVAAKIEALCQMYPTRTRTQIVGDLLSSALHDVEKSFPFEQGRQVGINHETDEPLYEDIGRGTDFRRIANKHYVAMEKELGTEKPEPLYRGERA
jgi:hypothetical protein